MKVQYAFEWLVQRRARQLSLPMQVPGPQRSTLEIFGDDDIVSHYLLHHGRYEAATLALMRTTLHKGATFVDAGAHLGAFTIPGAKLVGPKGLVHAFEPTPATHELLRTNTELNGLKQVKLHQTVLGSDQGSIQFFESNRQSGRNSVYESDGTPMTAQQITLDGAVDGDVALIKMDIEGSEMDCLRGAKNVLATEPVLSIESAPLELGIPERALQVYDLLTDAGFEAWVFKDGASGCRPKLVPMDRKLVATRDDNLIFATSANPIRRLT